ncbi:MAG: alpha/beta hydrolase [Bacteroidales bacterium]|jgi:acetyl esterase/lipase|nr:alpha/beta hydrolase [Bacteroidales bacterium]
MKKHLILWMLLLVGITCFAQDIAYLEDMNVPYYSETERKQDAYLAGRCVLDVYYPAQVKDFATVVWFHGGGLTAGEKAVPNELKEKGFAVIAVNYRLYPKVRCPEYIKDAAMAIAWVFRNIERYGGRPDLIFVTGHSAGAYLAMMTGLDKQWLQRHNLDADRIAGLIPLSGNAITHLTVREERGIKNTQPLVDEFAPLYHVRPDAPPLLLMTGDRELEMIGRYDENAYLQRMMKIAGHKNTVLYEFDGYGHDMTAPAFPLLVEFVRTTTKTLRP